MRAILVLAVVFLAACSPNQETAKAFVQRYVDAVGVDNRVAFFKRPERIKEIWADLGVTDKHKLGYIRVEKPTEPLEGWVVVPVLRQEGKNGLGIHIEVRTYYQVQRTDSGWLIDWEASQGHCDMTAREFALRRPRDYSVQFRVLAELAPIYPLFFPRDQEDQWWPLTLETQIGTFPPETLRSVIMPRFEPHGQEIYQKIKSGGRIPMTVVLRWGEAPDANYAVLERLDFLGWREP